MVTGARTRRTGCALALLVVGACSDGESVPIPRKQTIFDIPGADPSFADTRLVGFCVRDENGRSIGQIVGVTDYGRGGTPGYRLASAGGGERTVIPTAGIRERVISCP